MLLGANGSGSGANGADSIKKKLGKNNLDRI
jgi:hypothetical protein